MTKLMICVKSCQRDLKLGFHDVIRSTWGKDAKALGIDVRFFVGAEAIPYQSDEVHVKSADDYNALPYKTRDICRWANGKMVDYIFLCDTDTFLVPKKMLMCGFEKYDYVGKISQPVNKPFRYEHTGREGQKEHHEHCYPWASGGYGYFLSRKAFKEVAFEHPMSQCEDLWVGQVVGKMAAEGEASILSTAANVYSWHHPQHGEIYTLDVLKGWMEKMYLEQKS
jgi:Galactosyltransferase